MSILIPPPTPRLILRTWQESDIEPFIQLNLDKDVMEFFPSIPTPEETRQMLGRIQTHFDQHGFAWYAAERKDTAEFIGFIGFAKPRFEAHFTPCVEIGWRLAKKHWGQGFAPEGAKACLDFGFSELGFDTIYSFTAVPNQKSERVMQKIGMSYIGNFEHPNVPEGHLKTHVLYQIKK